MRCVIPGVVFQSELHGLANAVRIPELLHPTERYKPINSEQLRELSFVFIYGLFYLLFRVFKGFSNILGGFINFFPAFSIGPIDPLTIFEREQECTPAKSGGMAIILEFYLLLSICVPGFTTVITGKLMAPSRTQHDIIYDRLLSDYFLDGAFACIHVLA